MMSRQLLLLFSKANKFGQTFFHLMVKGILSGMTDIKKNKNLSFNIFDFQA